MSGMFSLKVKVVLRDGTLKRIAVAMVEALAKHCAKIIISANKVPKLDSAAEEKNRACNADMLYECLQILDIKWN